MLERLLIAGSGGQGIILLGKILATVATEEIEEVTFFPSYGAEVRGGTSNCQVVLSSEEITSPVPEDFESIIIMSQASAELYLPQAKDSCLVLLNSSICKAPENKSVTAINATDMAVELGSPRAANFIMLGAYVTRKRLLNTDALKDEIKKVFSVKNPDLADLNLKAFCIGMEQ